MDEEIGVTDDRRRTGRAVGARFWLLHGNLPVVELQPAGGWQRGPKSRVQTDFESLLSGCAFFGQIAGIRRFPGRAGTVGRPALARCTPIASASGDTVTMCGRF